MYQKLYHTRAFRAKAMGALFACRRGTIFHKPWWTLHKGDSVNNCAQVRPGRNINNETITK